MSTQPPLHIVPKSPLVEAHIWEPRDPASVLHEMLSHWGKVGTTSSLLLHPSSVDEEAENFSIAVIGRKGSAALGYISYAELGRGPMEEVLEAHEHICFDSYVTPRGSLVPVDEVQDFDIFDRYSGNGELVYINKIEVFHPHQQLGSRLLQHVINGDERELIFAHVINGAAATFFMKQGFEYTGLKNGDYGAESVFAMIRGR